MCSKSYEYLFTISYHQWNKELPSVSTKTDSHTPITLKMYWFIVALLLMPLWGFLTCMATRIQLWHLYNHKPCNCPSTKMCWLPPIKIGTLHAFMHSDRCVLLAPFCDVGANNPLCVLSSFTEFTRREEEEQQPPHLLKYVIIITQMQTVIPIYYDLGS